MKKDKSCDTDQISSPGGRESVILLLPSRHFKHCSLPADAGLRLLRKYCVFKRNQKQCI